MNIKKIKTKKLSEREITFLIIVILQILLLINMNIADSYFIHKTNPLIETPKIIENNEIKNLIDLGINFLTGILSIKQIGIVSADEISLVCCPETNEGAICQNILSGTESSIEPQSCASPIETNCDYVPDCEKGCCFDTEQGTCQPNSPKGKCENDGGEWFDDKDCYVAKCQEGCCVLGKNTKWTIERNCEWLSSSQGFPKNFKDTGTELECLALSASQEQGACILNERCSIKTEAECLSDGGSFEGGFCSDIDPECTKHNYTECLDEQSKYDVYYFDSCGNREDVAEECGYPQRKCVEGVCKNLGCENAVANVGTQDRLNGEKWCLYDSYIDDGKDTVGSEHWLAYCHEGEVEITRCGDARSYICVEKEEEGTSVSSASCAVNDAASCMNYNSEPATMAENCKANKDCMIKNVNVDTYFKFDFCVPRYPTGGTGFCSSGSQTCTAHYEKNWRGKWKCKENCNCQTTIFINQMNDFCISLGDCGTYINYIGEGTVNTVQPESPIQGQCDETVEEWEGNEPKDVCYWNKGKSIIGEYGIVEEIVGSGCFSSCGKLSSESVCEENKLCFWDEGTYTVWEGYVGRGCKSVCENLSNELACGNNTLCYWIGGESTEGVCNSACGELGETLCSCEKGAIEKLLDSYEIYAEPVAGQYAEPKDAREVLGMILGAGGDYDPNDEEDVNKALEKIGKISGALGIAAAYSTILMPGYVGGYSGIGGIVSTEGTLAAGVGAFANVAAGAGIGMLVGSWIAKELDISGDAATAMVISGGLAGAGIGYMIWTGVASGVGAWLAVIGIGIMIYIGVIGWGKTEGRDAAFTCLPWQAPVGGENCEKCNEDPDRPCTEYRCSSLGQACHLLNEDTDNPACESLAYETHPPVLSAGEVLTEDYTFTTNDFVDKKIRIEKENGECVQEYTSVNFTLETDEYAHCKYSFEIPSSVDYDEMEENYPLEGSTAATTHTFEINIPSIHALEVSGVTGDLKELFGNMNIYIKCQDYHGNSNIAPYVINFCINSEPDNTAAWIKPNGYSPKDGSYLSYGTTEKTLEILLNEPAECKYDTEEGKDYDDMEYSMTCETDSIALYTFGYCNTTLTNLTNENKFYIKCKDKPWWEDCSDEDKEKYEPRNINVEDFVYTLHVSENELEIDSIKISYKNQKITSGGVIKEGFEPISVGLEVKTSGGMDNGKSTCYWGKPLTTPFWEDYGISNEHKQPLTGRMGGNYNNKVKCGDKAGNVVQDYIEFAIEIDSDAPVIISNYTEGDDLIFETDELAECYYHLEKCNFNFEDGIKITTGIDTKHSIKNLNPKINYHIKCWDIYENKNPDCDMVIKATEENDYAPPTIVRAYYKKGELKLITNKRAKCYYGIYDCVFDLEEGKLMTDKKKEYSTEHATDWKIGQTYYIKCEDDWGNSNEENCAIIVEASYD